nr:DUF1829 domain-containing protein [uncultured Psychrobacter sp.]
MNTSILTIDSIEGHFDNYIKWLRDKTCFREVRNGWVEVTTPHLDRHNDCLQFYVKSDDSDIVFTDGGYIIDDLEASGVQLDSPKRRKILNEILNGLGITLSDNNELMVKGNTENFAVKKNNLIQAMLAVNDMFALATSNIASLFYEDVESWLEVNDIRYVPSIGFKGKSGFDFRFDFVIAKHKEHPERLLQTVNVPNKSNIEHLLFSWSDTKETRPENSKLYAIMNDIDNKISPTIQQSLDNYNVVGIPWSHRDEFVERLVA